MGFILFFNAIYINSIYPPRFSVKTVSGSGDRTLCSFVPLFRKDEKGRAPAFKNYHM
jgi:hypothetical protein